MNKRIYVFTFCIILTSCGIKKIVKSDLKEQEKSQKEILHLVKSKNNSPEFIYLKGRLTILKEDQETTLNINIKNKKDSVIWVSVRAALGIELIRAQITPDSLYFLNRANKTYLKKTSSYLKELISLTFSYYDLQDIVAAEPKILNKKYKTQKNESGFFMYTDNYNYHISNNYRIKKVEINTNKNILELIFSDFIEEKNFPRKVILKNSTKNEFEIVINYTKIEFNKPKKITFQIPDSYDNIK